MELRKKAEQSKAHEKFKRSSSILDEIQIGLGYSKTTKAGPSCSTVAPSIPTQIKKEVRPEVKNKPDVAPRPQTKLRREPTPRYDQRTKYDSGFHGYFFSCNGYGHRVIDCKSYARRDVGRPNT